MASKIRDVSSSTKFNWKIENFSKLNAEKGHDSDVFSVGPFKWTVRICPKGQGGGVYDHLSLGLMPIKLIKSVKVKFSFAVISQTDQYNTKKLEYKLELPEKYTSGCGWERFMRLSELRDPNKGYIVNDTCVIGVEVTCWMKYEDSKDGENFKEGAAKEGNKKNDEDEGTESDEDKKDDVDEDDATDKNQNQVVKAEIASTQSIRYPGAGQPFEEGQQYNKVGFCEDNHEYEDVGGFSILKTQAPLYKQIWLKYGHIPSTKVMPLALYPILVMAVKELMRSIIDMHECHYVDLSSEMIERWEGMITMAEKFEFNIGWLQDQFKHVKEGMCGMQNVKTELLEHGEGLRATKSKIRVLKNLMTKAEVKLIAEKDDVREKISGLLSESDMETYLAIGEDLLLDGLCLS